MLEVVGSVGRVEKNAKSAGGDLLAWCCVFLQFNLVGIRNIRMDIRWRVKVSRSVRKIQRSELRRMRRLWRTNTNASRIVRRAPGETAGSIAPCPSRSIWVNTGIIRL
jgi:hypothetical protein